MSVSIHGSGLGQAPARGLSFPRERRPPRQPDRSRRDPPNTPRRSMLLHWGGTGCQHGGYRFRLSTPFRGRSTLPGALWRPSALRDDRALAAGEQPDGGQGRAWRSVHPCSCSGARARRTRSCERAPTPLRSASESQWRPPRASATTTARNKPAGGREADPDRQDPDNAGRRAGHGRPSRAREPPVPLTPGVVHAHLSAVPARRSSIRRWSHRTPTAMRRAAASERDLVPRTTPRWNQDGTTTSAGYAERRTSSHVR